MLAVGAGNGLLLVMLWLNARYPAFSAASIFSLIATVLTVAFTYVRKDDYAFARMNLSPALKPSETQRLEFRVLPRLEFAVPSLPSVREQLVAEILKRGAHPSSVALALLAQRLAQEELSRFVTDDERARAHPLAWGYFAILERVDRLQVERTWAKRSREMPIDLFWYMQTGGDFAQMKLAKFTLHEVIDAEMAELKQQSGRAVSVIAALQQWRDVLRELPP